MPAALDREMLDQFASLGVDVTGAIAEEPAPRRFEVMEENWPALELFLGLQTQWRTHLAAKGGLLWLGLDYQAAESAMRMMRMKKRPDLFRDIQTMEDAALPVLNGAAPGEEDHPWL